MSRISDNYRIDNKVVAASLALSVFFLVLMAFRYKNTKECPPVDFSFRTANKFDVAYEKEKVHFSSEVKYNANEWEWDFGDKTPVDNTSGPYVSHEYAAPGVYTVRLTVNGKCEHVKNISIGKREHGRPRLYLRPAWPQETLTAGQPYNFADSTSGAKSWKWYFDGDDLVRSKQGVTYQFVEPGQYRVILVINDDLENGRAEKLFTVVAPAKAAAAPVAAVRPGGGGGGGRNPNSDIPFNPGPNEVTPAPTVEDYLKTPSLSEASLKACILDINGGGGTKLKAYFKNNDENTCSYIFNGKSITFDQLKANIEEHAKNGKSLNARQDVDPKGNYIRVIEITAELEPKRRLFGKKQRSYPF